MIKKLIRYIRYRRALKLYIDSNMTACFFGQLIGARPYFISFEEFLERNKDNKYLHKYYENNKEEIKAQSREHYQKKKGE